MKCSPLFLLTIVLLLLASCKINSKDKEVATNLFTQIGGGGNVGFVKQTLENGIPSSKKFIELKIDSSSILNQNGITKSLLASYCASYLYQNLEEIRSLEYEGINILYSDELFETLEKPYYFEMSELMNISQISKKLYDFLQSIAYGTDSQDFLSKNNDNTEISNINKGIQTLDSLGLIDPKLIYWFHSRYPENHKYADKFLIIWVVQLPNNQNIAINFIVNKKNEDDIICNLEITI
tara:strand:+ start:807 stop:1517 length:711 start_codon:yes stop_codon:yes gene_type:complete